MIRLRNVVRLRDMPKLAWWLRMKSNKPVTIGLKDSTQVTLRPEPSLDFMIFYEIFVNHAYEPVWTDLPPVSRIVDVGGYVGYSVLFWSKRFPGCTMTVYEPSPEHAECIRGHLALNELTNVTVRPVAAGATAGKLMLTSGSAASRVSTEGTVPIDMVDFFADVKGPVDLLKLDCEGGEHALLADPRFAELKPQLIVMECHDDASNASSIAAKQLGTRLVELGYECQIDNAMIWARRRAS